ncbi:MAG: FHA domain-containing protein [Deltaproteobacteria bacterium]|nr:FHA domain-containing protein [Deltaproteobacteria bacterium]
MAPLRDSGVEAIKEVQLFHINKGGRGLIYTSRGSFTITVGRSGCDISFENDRYLSPIHAKIENTIEGLKIIDAGSYNGIFVKVRGSKIIKVSDIFICGSQMLKFLGVLSRLTPYVLPDGTTFYGSMVPDVEYLMIQQILGIRKLGDLYLRRAPLIIGRDKGDIIFQQDKFLSSTHCSIIPTSDGFVINDLSSANGIYLKVRGSEWLFDGDILLMGQELIMVKVV